MVSGLCRGWKETALGNEARRDVTCHEKTFMFQLAQLN